MMAGWGAARGLGFGSLPAGVAERDEMEGGGRVWDEP